MARAASGSISRRALLRSAAAGGGASIAAATLPLGALVPRRVLAMTTPDVATLTDLVTLEDTAVYLYGKLAAAIAPPSAAAGATAPPSALEEMAGFPMQHSFHRDALVQALKLAGGVVPPLDAEHPGVLPASTATADALNALARLESGITGGQYAALGSLSKAGLVSLVASLYGVAARRQAVVSRAAGRGELQGPLVTGDAAATAALLAGKA